MSDQTTPADAWAGGEPTVPLVGSGGYTQPDVPPLEPTTIDPFGSGLDYPDFSYDQPAYGQPGAGSGYIDPNPLPSASNYAQPSVPPASAYAAGYRPAAPAYAEPAQQRDPYLTLEPPTNQLVQYQQPPLPAPTPFHDPVGYDYGYARPVASLPEHPNAVLSLVLGLVGLFVMPVLLSPIAWVLAARGRSQVAANPGRWATGGSMTAGLVLGILGTVMWGLVLLAWVGFFVLIFAGMG